MDAIYRRSPDLFLFIVVLILIGVGIVMIYSASSIVALEQYGDSAYFLKHQLMWAVLGAGCLSVALVMHYESLRRLTPGLLLLGFVLLIAVWVPGLGREAGGARRWISAGGFTFQPAEAAKLILLLYLANFLTNKGPRVLTVRALAPPVVITGAMFGLVLIQPDMGSSVVLAALCAAMLFLGGARLRDLSVLGVGAIPALGALAVLEPYRVRRLLAFVNPWADPQGSGFHIIQSLLALGSGGLLGVGLGASRQKFFYLPERHTDFVFAILGEELGLAGTAAVLLLFALVAYRGFRIARLAPDRYGALLAAGITTAVVGQAILNIAVATGLLPITGVPLPFISFGGSSLIITCTAMGILLNISRYSNRAQQARPEAS